MCKDLHSTSVARRDTIPAQRRETPATCREPCPSNKRPRPDTATAKSMARCGTISAQRHISAQPAGTKARRLVRTLREDAHKGSYPPNNLTPKQLLPRDCIHIHNMREVFKNAIVPQQHPCVGVAQCAKRGGALHRPNDYKTDVSRDESVAPQATAAISSRPTTRTGRYASICVLGNNPPCVGVT